MDLVGRAMPPILHLLCSLPLVTVTMVWYWILPVTIQLYRRTRAAKAELYRILPVTMQLYRTRATTAELYRILLAVLYQIPYRTVLKSYELASYLSHKLDVEEKNGLLGTDGGWKGGIIKECIRFVGDACRISGARKSLDEPYIG